MSRKLEREMKLGTITSRRSLMEREKAMEAARNPGVSKFGDCLVSINLKNDKVLTSNIRKINSEIKRMQLQVNHKMKHFLKKSTVLNHDPIILVERPPSPEVVKRAFTMMSADPETGYPELGDENKPSYMRQLRSKARTPSTLTTIDAFTVKQRKKKNVWEGALDDKAAPEFRGTVRPFAKLTRREKSDLKKGYEFHKPKLEVGQDGQEANTSNKTKQKKTKSPKELFSDDSDFENEITPFITQMANVRNRKKERKEHTIAEINVHTRTPDMVIQDLTSPIDQLTNDRSVRFKSPLPLSAPKGKRGNRPKATKITV
ncbi:hypothetical protein ACF0H5_012077 [Mactra antiquata]